MTQTKRRLRILSASTISLASVWVAPAAATGTLAGETITNIASATYDDGTGPVTINSNPVPLLVDEVLDVTLTGLNNPVLVQPGATNRVTTFQLTNSGNGPEAFTLTATGTLAGDQFDPTVTAIFIDANNNGTYDVDDTPYVSGPTATVAADGSLTVFVISSIPAGATNGQVGDVELTATAVTGSGTTGTRFPNAGLNNSDAVVGTTTASADTTGRYQIAAISVALVKSVAVISNPQGTTDATPGARLRYTITANVTGTGTATGLIINDPIPALTTYATNSLFRGTTNLTDTGADADGGQFTGTHVQFNLGDVPAGESRTVTFDAIIVP